MALYIQRETYLRQLIDTAYVSLITIFPPLPKYEIANETNGSRDDERHELTTCPKSHRANSHHPVRHNVFRVLECMPDKQQPMAIKAISHEPSKGHVAYQSDILSMLQDQSPPHLQESNTPPSHWPPSATASHRQNTRSQMHPSIICQSHPYQKCQ